MTVSFVMDASEFSFAQYWRIVQMLELYFNTRKDESQSPITKAEAKWVKENIPKCVCVLCDGKKVIGLTFFLPTTKKLMKRFIEKKVSEKKLWSETKQLFNQKNSNEKIDCLYLSSAFILPKYRRKSLAKKAFIQSIKKFTQTHTIKPILFFWGFSIHGKKLAKSISRSLKLKLLERK